MFRGKRRTRLMYKRECDKALLYKKVGREVDFVDRLVVSYVVKVLV
jgi:hypothetical protein